MVYQIQRFEPIFHCNAKTFTLGPRVGLDPQCYNFALGKPRCWYVKMLKFALPPTRNIKCALPQMQNINASQWNISCVGSSMQNFRVGHVHFMLFVLISFALVTQLEPSLQWNIGFSLLALFYKIFCSYVSNTLQYTSIHFLNCNRTSSKYTCSLQASPFHFFPFITTVVL